ncbi:hypothetical protein AX16_008126 [Volvariella volvacea WC 439]|nr:hypothetical protein AX16_008126 [Volvariella volvacea WC 439]
MPGGVSTTARRSPTTPPIVETPVFEATQSMKTSRSLISVVLLGLMIPLLIIVCCSTPIINQLYVFTLKVYPIDEPTRVVDYGLWGYCIRPFAGRPERCSSPTVGWEIAKEVVLFLGAPELVDAISSSRSSTAILVPINAALVFISFLMSLYGFKLNRSLAKDLKLKSFILPTMGPGTVSTSTAGMNSHLRAVTIMVVFNFILFLFTVVTLMVTFSLGWALFGDIANAIGGSDVWLSFGPAPGLFAVSLFPEVWNLCYLFTLRSELKGLDKKMNSTAPTARRTPTPPNVQTAGHNYRFST